MIGGCGAAVVLGGLACLLLVLAAVSGWQGTSRLTESSDETAAVEHAAGSFVEAYGTFDFRNADAYREHLLTLTTGAIREAVAASQVDPVAVSQRRTMVVTVVATHVTAMSEDGATASVTAEQLRRGTDPASGLLTEERVDQRLTCLLEKEGGRWLVAEFRLLSEEPIEPGDQN